MMARLSVCLLGSLYVTLDDESVTGFESDKARALFAYLIVETERPHRREKLAGLLWPEWSEGAARANLRHTLANLRQIVGDRARVASPNGMPPFLQVSRQAIQLNTDSDVWVDVTAFTELLRTKGLPREDIRQVEEAVRLYRGDFLEGFSIGDSPAFEEWVLLKRERLHRLVTEALHRLADAYEQRGELKRALQHTWRQVELDPWRERAHRQLMRLLALSGQRGAALAQYGTCRRLLAEELGVEPAEETTRLYEQVRDGKFTRGAEEQRGRGAVAPAPATSPTIPAARHPSFLDGEEAVDAERPVFVAREHELAQLEGFLGLALAGQGQVVFVTGEAGSGKTALAQAFTRRAQDALVDLAVAGGNSNAYTGIGDPYLPFRQILQRLTGDVEAQWAAGTVTTKHARRLWHMLPLAAQELVEVGPDLIDTFVPGKALLDRAAASAPGGTDWLTHLHECVKRGAPGAGGPGPQQGALFEQYTRVLQALARQRPLVLVLDDLQWADAGSINLLFHLGRRVSGSRILIVGAYRPEEVALGRGGERHPLEPVVNELRRDFGDVMLNLDRAAGWDFVEAFLDTEPNRLGIAFRQTLYRQTWGHPLFTIELLRGLQERGDLLQDSDGRWFVGPELDWERLPARVEAVIAERIGRLAEPQRRALQVASVQGETFTAEVVARVQRADEREMVTRLSGELDRRHRLVRAESILRIGDRRLSRYRFRHILFQNYLYGTLDEVERVHLHEDVGTALEGLYGDWAEDIAVQLARHFQEAGLVEKAVRYLHQAGTQAARLSANEEAIVHITTALELLKSLPETLERDRWELSLQLALVAPHQAARGYAAPETGRAYARAYELSQRMGGTPDLLPALWSLGSFYLARAEHRKSHQLTEQLLSLAQQMEDTLQVAMARWGLGVNLVYMGALEPARAHLEYVIAFYDPEQHRSLALTFGQDPGVSALAWASWALWFLGYPDRALERSREALALASELDHPFTLGFALNIAGSLFHQLRRENRTAREQNEAMLQLSAEQGFPFFQLLGGILQGRTQALAGQVEEGKAQMRQGLDTLQAIGTGMHRPHLLALLVDACAVAGQPTEALSVAAEALAFVEQSSERYYEAELHRLRGELLLQQGDVATAEASFLKAIEVARSQHAKSWELRATLNLCRLWQRQGKREEARQRLAEIYGWFTEGLDTPDLQEARALLGELARS
jgi:DNA-binding SARP family transcriptional activator/predicted ATPase